jgi:cell division protease FtsH
MTLGPEGVTTGASNDIQRATEMARNMVTKWGLSERLGPQMYAEDDGEVFLGRSAGGSQKHSGETAKVIDEEVKSIIDHCYNKAKQLLDDNRDKLELMKDALMEYETIDVEQINDIMSGRKPRPPADWSDSDSDSGSGSARADSNDDGRDGSSDDGRDGSSDDSRSDKPVGGPVSDH